MVKTRGKLLPGLMTLASAEFREDLTENRAQLKSIINSVWDGANSVDPSLDDDDPAKRPFRADAIISNPTTYAHIHT